VIEFLAGLVIGAFASPAIMQAIRWLVGKIRNELG
jgi:hypothetical protein